MGVQEGAITQVVRWRRGEPEIVRIPSAAVKGKATIKCLRGKSGPKAVQQFSTKKEQKEDSRKPATAGHLKWGNNSRVFHHPLNEEKKNAYYQTRTCKRKYDKRVKSYQRLQL